MSDLAIMSIAPKILLVSLACFPNPDCHDLNFDISWVSLWIDDSTVLQLFLIICSLSERDSCKARGLLSTSGSSKSSILEFGLFDAIFMNLFAT